MSRPRAVNVMISSRANSHVFGGENTLSDHVQKIQLVFVANCRDETATRHGVQRFFEWLRGSGERERLVKRAGARRRIVETIAQEQP